MMTWSFWFRRLVEVTVALTLAFMVIQLSSAIGQKQKALVPVSAWFVVNEVFVPDHEYGTNPLMVYDRSIKEDFRGFWIVEVQRLGREGLWSNECSGSGTSDYDITDFIVGNQVKWGWFIGRPCAVSPGDYRLRIGWTLRRLGWPEKELAAFSNTFTVE